MHIKIYKDVCKKKRPARNCAGLDWIALISSS